ncbi:MAG TPA: hypothetical protein PLK35_02255 [Candidatus Moranbacteria bacterium]|nr:hypothetical protein [Candidatus Moranbacteria bacterium]
MKKATMLFVMLAGLVLSGCGQKTPSEIQVPDTQKESVTPESNNDTGIVTSIKDAMGLNRTMECTYSIKNEMEAKSYVQGNKIKSFTDIGGVKNITLFDGETFYMWIENKSEGTKMTKTCMEEMAKDLPKPSGENTASPADLKDIQEGYKDAMNVKCQSASDVDFSVPSNIVFADQCEMMKAMMKGLSNMKLPNAPQ